MSDQKICWGKRYFIFSNRLKIIIQTERKISFNRIPILPTGVDLWYDLSLFLLIPNPSIWYVAICSTAGLKSRLCIGFYLSSIPKSWK